MQTIKRISPWRRPSDVLRSSRSHSSPSSQASPVATSDAPSNDKDAEIDALNRDLQKVVNVFPDVQPEVFRELLVSFSGESRLYLVTEALLMNKPKVVRGRWRTDSTNKDENNARAGLELLPKDECFRDDAYKTAVLAAFYDEFKSLSHSAIRAVLAEHNYSYTDTRPALLLLNSSSWTSTFMSWLSRRKVPSSLNHPLIDWDSTDSPSVRPLSNSELAEELRASLVAPARLERLQTQVDADSEKAEALNDEEAEAENATLDCECCFTGSAFERIAVCTDKGHFICYRCLRHTISEAIYGQGWSQSVDPEHYTLKCVALDDGCTGHIPQQLLKQSIMTDKSGNETWSRFENRLVTDSLTKSGLDLLKCPTCNYAEVAPISTPPSTQPPVAFALLLTLLFASLIALHALESIWLVHELIAFTTRLLAPLLFCLVLLSGPRKLQKLANKITAKRLPRSLRGFQATLTSLLTSPDPLHIESPAPTTKGRKFTCGNGHISCLVCKSRWTDPHACFAAHTTSLRAFIEAALTAATKRTCPLCGLSFVKDSGCNKLACPCGYKMCYLCRADVRRAGYAHFCPHFRASGTGTCPEACGRCDLYKDEEVALEQVKADAAAEWWASEGARRGIDADRAVMQRSLVVGSDEPKGSRWSWGRAWS